MGLFGKLFGKASQPVMPAVDPLADFVVERELGRGGFGVVHLVKNRLLGTRLAVKELRIPDERSRQMFANEMISWFNLPAHPNLMPCSFVRTVDDRVYIFSPVATGGSVAGTIESRSLYKEDGLARVLDVAIQTARGLAALHAEGMVHLDIKPANVLLDDTWEARVADFGLASMPDAVRAAFDQRDLRSRAGGEVEVHALTPAFASPEQLLVMQAGTSGAVTSASDVYSWGAMLVSMFVGGVTWPSGNAVPSVLSAIGSGQVSTQLAVPPQVFALVARTLDREPGARGSMAEVADALRDVYATLVAPYPRAAAQVAPRASTNGEVIGEMMRNLNAGMPWRLEDPRKLLETALVEAGRDPSGAVNAIKPAITRRAQIVSDLVVLAEARRVCVAANSQKQRVSFATSVRILLAEASSLEFIQDTSGCLASIDAAVSIVQSSKDVSDLARQVYEIRARIRRSLGDASGSDADGAAMAKFPATSVRERVIAIVEQADSLRRARRFAESDALYETAASLVNEPTASPGELEPLASCLNNWSLGRLARQDHRGALALLERARAIRERTGAHTDTRTHAATYMNLSTALDGVGRSADAKTALDTGITILDAGISEFGRIELEDSLARARMNRGVQLMEIEPKAALESIRAGLALFQRQVVERGNTALIEDLARGYPMAVVVAMKARELEAAVAFAEKGAKVFRPLISASPERLDLVAASSRCSVIGATALLELGRPRPAYAAVDAAGTLLATTMERFGRDDELMECIQAAGQICMQAKAKIEAQDPADRHVELMMIRAQVDAMRTRWRELRDAGKVHDALEAAEAWHDFCASNTLRPLLGEAMLVLATHPGQSATTCKERLLAVVEFAQENNLPVIAVQAQTELANMSRGLAPADPELRMEVERRFALWRHHWEAARIDEALAAVRSWLQAANRLGDPVELAHALESNSMHPGANNPVPVKRKMLNDALAAFKQANMAADIARVENKLSMLKLMDDGAPDASANTSDNGADALLAGALELERQGKHAEALAKARAVLRDHMGHAGALDLIDRLEQSVS